MIDKKAPIPFDRDQRLIERIEKLMAGAPYHCEWIDWTPGLCQHAKDHWLGTHNRTEKARAIVRYAADMLAGNWRKNGETMSFTDKGVIGNGQNRILACIKADTPFTSLVVFGVPHAEFLSMDQGRVRTPADLLKIEGVSNSDFVHAALRWCELLAIAMTGRGLQRAVSFTGPEILALWRDKHGGVADFIKEAREIAGRNEQPVGMVAAMLYTFDKIDSELAHEFSLAWLTGTRPPRFRGITAMQAELLRIKNKASGRVHEAVRAAMIINAWNAARNGGRGSIIWSLGMKFPKIK